MRSAFVFALCAPGSEQALKAEVSRRRLGWTPSYQRAGFVTFKRAEGGPLPELVFARELSASLGRLPPPWTRAGLRALAGEGGDLRVSARVAALDATAARLAATLGAGPTAPPKAGERVLEVVVTGEDEAWVGEHRHGPGHSPHPGGLGPSEPPPEAPSRAYLKVEAVIAWASLTLRPGEHAVELGSAPGGTSWALLERGLEVLGIDPNAMDPRVLAHPRFRLIPESVRRLEAAKLPARTDWLLADMNIAPRLTLEAAEALAARLRPRGLVLTLKLKDLALAHKLPAWCEQLRRAGYTDVRAKQLSPHGQELVLVATR